MTTPAMRKIRDHQSQFLRKASPMRMVRAVWWRILQSVNPDATGRIVCAACGNHDAFSDHDCKRRPGPRDYAIYHGPDECHQEDQ